MPAVNKEDIFADYYEQYCVDDLIKLHMEKQRGR